MDPVQAAAEAAAAAAAAQELVAAQVVADNIATADAAQAAAELGLRVAQAALATAAAAAQQAAAARMAVDPLATAKPFRPYGTPPYLDFEIDSKKFANYLTRIDLFFSLSNIDESMPVHLRSAYKAKILLSCMAPDTLEEVSNAGLGPAAMADHAQILAHLQQRADSGKNRHTWRLQFRRCVQTPNASADSWLCELRDLSRKCEWHIDCCARSEQGQLLGQIMFGAADADAQLDFSKAGDGLTLEQAIVILKALESAKQQVVLLQGGGVVQGVRFKSSYKSNKAPRAAAAAGDSPKCPDCGYPIRGPVHNCPAKDPNKTCTKCTKTGHFIKVCPLWKTPGVKAIRIRRVAGVATPDSDVVKISIAPHGATAVELEALPDTGSSLDAIPPSLYHQQFPDIKLRAGVDAETATGSRIKTLGSFKASVDWRADDGQSRPVESTVHVLVDLKQPVLSKITQRKMGMIPENYPHARAEPRKLTVNSVAASSGGANRVAVSSEAANSVAASSVAVGQKMKDLAELFAAHPKVFDGVCRPMDGPPVHLTLKEGAIPVQAKGYKITAVPLEEPYRKELAKQRDDGLLRRVPPGTLTPWIHRSVIVPKDPKPNGEPQVRITIDFRALNEWLTGTKFHNPTPLQAVRCIPSNARFFTLFDGLKGYHMVALDEESMALTTHLTIEGLHQCTRLPMGAKVSGDEFGSRFDSKIGDIPNTVRCMEDILAFAETYDEMIALNKVIVERAEQHNISFNRHKTEAAFAVEEVDFAGYRVNCDGYRPSPELTRAIAEFPRPLNRTDLRSFNGLCQQVGNFCDKISEALGPLYFLLKKKTAWDWSENCETAFQEARKLLSVVPILSFYDVDRPTSLYSDASRLNGLGFILKQQQEDGTWKLVQAGSRHLTDTESAYAMIELEALAAAWAMKKCRPFLEGLKFKLFIDHQPLIPIMNDYALDEIDNTRLLLLRRKMLRYDFKAIWIPGKENIEADALSRAPVDQATKDDEIGEGPQFFTSRKAVVGLIAGSTDKTMDTMLESIKAAAASDPVMEDLRQVILEGFPNEKRFLKASVGSFWDMRHRLAIDDSDGMIVCGARVVIPRSVVPKVLDVLTQMHQGASKMRQRARLSVYWPGMDNDISNAAANCSSCTSRLPSQPAEPLKQHEPATRPFEQIYGDLGEEDGRMFLALVDAFSGWPHVAMFPDKHVKSRRVIDALREFFATFGAPVKFWSDNGPQFTAAEIQKFLRHYNVTWGSSAPYYPQSNGTAEAVIKQMKKLIIGSKRGGRVDPDMLAQALMVYRNAPRSGGASPAELVFNSPIRDGLPVHGRSFKPEWQRTKAELKQRTDEVQKKNAARYNVTAHTLIVLKVGDQVLIQNPKTHRWDTAAVVTEIGPNRDYMVRTKNGANFRRNRRHLLRRTVTMPGPIGPPASIPGATPPIHPAPPANYAEAVFGNQPPPAVIENTIVDAAEPAAPQPATRRRRAAAPEPAILRRSTRIRGPPPIDTTDPNSKWTK